MTKSHYGNFWNHQKNHAMENHTMEIHVSEGIAVLLYEMLNLSIAGG